MKPDMSPRAVTRRLQLTSELRRLCIMLGGKRLKERLAGSRYPKDQREKPPR